MSRRLTTIIKHYSQWKSHNPDSWVLHCRNQQRLQDVIHSAALSENATGEKHPHQYRLKKADLETFEMNLLKKRRAIQNAANFDILYQIIETSACKGIGELAIYDTSVRIGAFLNLSPDRIYLHAGTKVGAGKLIGNLKGKTLDKTQLPLPLRNSNLNCYELEDLLCIYKHLF